MTTSSLLESALKLPNGARFYRCAFQVNPFQYLVRHNRQGRFSSEGDYNAEIVAACQEAKIEVLGVTDHYRVKHSASLVQAARSAGLWAFSGFEAVAKDGVHFLCLFDPEKDDLLERFIGFFTDAANTNAAVLTFLSHLLHQLFPALFGEHGYVDDHLLPIVLWIESEVSVANGLLDLGDHTFFPWLNKNGSCIRRGE